MGAATADLALTANGYRPDLDREAIWADQNRRIGRGQFRLSELTPVLTGNFTSLPAQDFASHYGLFDQDVCAGGWSHDRRLWPHYILLQNLAVTLQPPEGRPVVVTLRETVPFLENKESAPPAIRQAIEADPLITLGQLPRLDVNECRQLINSVS